MRVPILKYILLCLLGYMVAISVSAQSISPTMTIERSTGNEEVTDFSGSGPVIAHFRANPSNHLGYQAIFQWTMTYAGKNSPFLVRYDEDVDYTFLTTKQSQITLKAYFIQETDTIVQTINPPFSVIVTASKLEMPNAFTPNGDGVNDIYKAKSTHESILSFKGYIFSRWGKKIFEWDDINSGWDGTINGSEAPEGVYYCRIIAEGTDGVKYNIRKDVNLLRQFNVTTTSTP